VSEQPPAIIALTVINTTRLNDKSSLPKTPLHVGNNARIAQSTPAGEWVKFGALFIAVSPIPNFVTL
jgi:hypothetical protein